MAARPTPIDMLRRGVCYFPSDRVAEGLALGRPVRENASMAALDLPTFSKARVLRRACERLPHHRNIYKQNHRPPHNEWTGAHQTGAKPHNVDIAHRRMRCS